LANEIRFKVFGDVKNFENGLKAINAQVKAVTRTAKFAFVGLSAAIAGTTALAKKQERALNQTKAVLRSTGSVAGITAEEVAKLGKELQAITTFGDEAVISAQNLLLTFKSIGKDIFPDATKAVLNISAAMNQGLKESAVQVGKALNDPVLGLTALRRVGIQFEKSQEDQIKAMVAMGNTAKAQKIILRELESQFGGSAEAAREGLGAIDALKNSLGDLGEAIGFELAPTIEKLSKNLTELSDAAQENKPIVRLIANALLLGAAFSGVVVIVGTVFSAIATIGTVGTAVILGLVITVGTLITKWTELRDAFITLREKAIGEEGVLTKISNFVSKMIEENGVLTKMRDMVTGIAEKAREIAGAIRDKLPFFSGPEADLGSITVTRDGAVEDPIEDEKKKAKLTLDIWGDVSDRLKKMWQQESKWYSDAKNDQIGTLRRTITEAAALNKTAAMAAKAFAYGEAIINIAAGVTRAFREYAWPYSLVVAGLVAAQGAVQIATINAQSFAVGTPSVPDDQMAMVHRREMIVPETFATAIRQGELTLSGGGTAGGGITYDFSGAVFNGVTEEFVTDVIVKASEMTKNRTLISGV
jgi:hypothetical protein